MTTVVIGAGQAGLAVSHELTNTGVEHVVLERGAVAQAWRDRWDSFTLVGPNWTMRLPDGPYAGPDPDGFSPRDEIVAYLQGYADDHAGPIREGVAVDALAPGRSTRFLLTTNAGEIEADTVVVTTGAYQRQHRPAFARGLPDHIEVVGSAEYRRPDQLPAGRVLVVGSGQTGVQLAEELHLAGRDVVIACGRAPWAPRRIGGRDLFAWAEDAGFFDQTRSSLPSAAARLGANVQMTGARGGHDLNYRVLQGMGVTLAGRLLAVDGQRASFAGDLAESVAFGDARRADLARVIRDALGPDAPDFGPPPPFVATGADAPDEVDLADFGAVLLTAGFRPDYASWVAFPVFDPDGFPIVVDDDLRTAVPGLHFCGVHFLRNRRSSLLWGVGDDAAIIASAVAHDRGD